MAENIGSPEILRDTDLEQKMLAAVIADRNDQPRSKQLQVGPSEVGGCRELLRAGLFESETVAEPETAWATAAHAGTVFGADLERIFGLIGGDIFHGALSLNQLFSARPMVGQADYRGAVPGLYLCGAGTHPGGGVTGAPGHNAAKVIISDLC